MSLPRTISIPVTVRIKPGALDRLGIYLARQGVRSAALLASEGLLPELRRRAEAACRQAGVELQPVLEVADASFAGATALFTELPDGCEAVIGLGGGKALDVAKYVAFLARRPYHAVPTSLSNDGFCSPGASLDLQGRKRSFAARLPHTVIVDTEVCRRAPDALWWSGVGDLVAKVTAVRDWKIAFHTAGTPVDDFAALLGEATVWQFMARPERDLEGVRLLATCLMLNGIAMEIAGSSRPASGSEHLISHALDEIAARPAPHGIQVGMAAYLCSRLQEATGGPPSGQADDADQFSATPTAPAVPAAGDASSDPIARVLTATGFWDGVRRRPFSRGEWLEAVRLAPSLRPGHVTVLSTRDCRPEVERLLAGDPRLEGCFV